MKNKIPSAPYSTPFNVMKGSSIISNADIRRFPMAADLVHRSYVSSTLLDTFLKDTPEVTQKHVLDLYEKDEWKDFMAKCTDRKKNDPSTHGSSDSNEEEF